MSFEVDGRFDLVLPEDINEQYGIRLGNGTADHNTVQLTVRRDASGVNVVLTEIDFINNTAVTLQSIALAPRCGRRSDRPEARARSCECRSHRRFVRYSSTTA